MNDEIPTVPTIRQRVEAEVPGLRLPPLPRRFAMYQVPVFDADPTLYCWGAQLPNAALAYFPDGTHFGKFVAAGQLLKILGYGRELGLVWLDAPAAEQ